MVMEKKTLGYIQLAGAFVALWAIWQGNVNMAVSVVAVVLLATGFNQVQAGEEE